MLVYQHVWFGTRHSLAKLPTECCSLTVCSSVIQCADVVRDLVVLLDSKLSMQSHISKVTSACFYLVRRLRQIRNYVTQEVKAQLVTSLVISRLDYCNSALASLPASTLAPLQSIQNAAGRLVLNLDRRSHITTAAARQVLHHLQDRDATFYIVVSRRPGCIQHDRLSSTATQVVAYQGSHHETDTDPIR